MIEDNKKLKLSGSAMGKGITWRLRYKIKCAALRCGDHIVAGAYHGECLRIAIEAGFVIADSKMNQGFLTEGMRFVRRREALAIAEYHDQIKIKHSPKDILLSEDLK